MAFTKITNAGFGLTTGTLVGVAASFSSTVSVGGTLTYEDVTNVDSVGLITARNGVKFGASGTTVVGNSNGIGVGTDNPGSNKLQVQGSSALYGNGGVSAVWGDTSYLGALSFDGSAQPVIRTASSKALIFQVNQSTEAARFDSSGNFGLGTSSPTTNLEINGGTNNNIVRIVSTDANANIEFADNTTTSGCQIGANGDNLKFGINGTESMRIDSSGRLLLGTTTEGDVNADNLTIADSGNCGMTIRSGTSSSGGIFFSDGTSGDAEYRGQVYYDHNSDYMRFSTAASERMRIDSSGNMGLGTASPSDYGNFADDLVIYNSSQPGITLATGTTGYGSIYFADGTAGNTASRGQIQYNHNNDSLLFATAANERMRIDSSGSLLVNTSTSRSVMDQAGNGPTPKLQIEGEDSSGIISVISAGDADANRCGTINLGRHRNGTVGGTPTIVQDGDALGAVVFSGGDGGDMLTCGAKIHAVVDGTPGANDMPGALIFSTTPDGQGHGFNTERVRIDSSGSVLIGTASQMGSNYARLSIDCEGRDVLSDATDITKYGLAFHNDPNTNDANGIGFFNDDGTACGGYIVHQDKGSNNIGDLVFGTSATANAPAERMRITSSGRLLIATSASQGKWNNSSGDDHIVQIESTSAFSQSWISHSTSSTAGVQLDIGRSRGSSDGDTTVVNSGDLLGHLCFQGADGSQFVRGARIAATVDGTPGADDMPTRLTFETTADGASSPTERLRIDKSGRLLVGTTSASGDSLLQVAGPIQTGEIRTAHHSRSYTASTSATDVFLVRFISGHAAAEFTWFYTDGSYPNGARVGKIYMAVRGSGANISAVSVSSSSETGIQSGTITTLTWSAAKHDNSHIVLKVTGSTTSGNGTIHLYGVSPFFDTTTPITDA